MVGFFAAWVLVELFFPCIKYRTAPTRIFTGDSYWFIL